MDLYQYLNEPKGKAYLDNKIKRYSLLKIYLNIDNTRKIPLQKINPTEFKVDCSSYFNENMKTNNSSKPKDDPMKDYSKKNTY